jgi:UDP-N-acetyl-2-amino-2-deoxyglucuronate dehydrogenase
MTDASAARVGFGIIGCGGAALPVATALAGSAVAALRAVHDRSLPLARDLGEQYGVPCAVTLDELLAEPGVQAVYVAVPHDQLAPLARRALEAGKHALVEKPMALALADADALIDLAETRGLALGVFYELRHTAAHRRARALVQAGALGTLTAVRLQTIIDKRPDYWQRGLTGRSTNSWRASRAQAGGGVVLMNTSHALDALRYVTGLEVAGISGQTDTWVPGVEVEDTAAATLRLSNGALGSLFAGAHLAGGGEERTDLYGTQGQMRLPDPYGNGPLELYLRRPWGDLAADTWHRLPQTPVNAYALALDDFAQAVQHGQPAPTSGRDARAVLATVLALYESAATQPLLAVTHETSEVKHA